MIETTARLRELCHDPEAEVRFNAIRALHDLGASDWPSQARNGLDDDNNDVVFTSLNLLSKSKFVTKEILLPLIESPDARKRQMGISKWGASGFTVSDAPWLEARIHDAVREVRRSVIIAANKSRDRAFLPRLREMAMREDGEFDSLVDNTRVVLLRRSPRWWIFWVTTSIVGAVIFNYQPWALLAWIPVAVYVGWRMGIREFLWPGA